MLGSRWVQKPPVGTPLDTSSPLAVGLIAFWPFAEGTGAASADLGPNGLTMQLSNPSGTGWSAGPGGPALAARVDASFPSAAALASFPFTVAFGMTPLSVPGSSALYLDFGSTQSGLAQIRAGSGGTWGLGTNSNPWDATSSLAIAPSVGMPVVAAATFGTSGSQLYLGGGSYSRRRSPGPTRSMAGAPTSRWSTPSRRWPCTTGAGGGVAPSRLASTRRWPRTLGRSFARRAKWRASMPPHRFPGSRIREASLS